MKTEVRIHHNMAGWLLKLLPSVKILTLLAHAYYELLESTSS